MKEIYATCLIGTVTGLVGCLMSLALAINFRYTARPLLSEERELARLKQQVESWVVVRDYIKVNVDDCSDAQFKLYSAVENRVSEIAGSVTLKSGEVYAIRAQVLCDVDESMKIAKLEMGHKILVDNTDIRKRIKEAAIARWTRENG